MTYTYKCKKCGVRFETKQSIHDDSLTDCDDCHTEGSLERVITLAGDFRIWGGGVEKPTSSLYT
jgi:putative FmdB family regulatory protein